MKSQEVICLLSLIIRSLHLADVFDQVLPHLTTSLAARASELQRKLASKERSTQQLPNSSATGGGGLSVVGGNEQKMKEQLDDIVASECIYCGEFMIRLACWC